MKRILEYVKSHPLIAAVVFLATVVGSITTLIEAADAIVRWIHRDTVIAGEFCPVLRDEDCVDFNISLIQKLGRTVNQAVEIDLNFVIGGLDIRDENCEDSGPGGADRHSPPDGWILFSVPSGEHDCDPETMIGFPESVVYAAEISSGNMATVYHVQGSFLVGSNEVPTMENLPTAMWGQFYRFNPK